MWHLETILRVVLLMSFASLLIAWIIRVVWYAMVIWLPITHPNWMKNPLIDMEAVRSHATHASSTDAQDRAPVRAAASCLAVWMRMST